MCFTVQFVYNTYKVSLIATDNKERKKTKHAHMKMEIKENATRTNTN
jgi:hypothetical protein